MINFRMMLADAQKMGIRISDEGVNDFLKRLTQGKLTKQEFKDCLREARLGEGDLFEQLKDELAVQLAFELTYPPAFVAIAPPSLAQFVREPLRYMQQTPQQLWESYQMLNLKESLQAVAIPVKEFVGDVAKPSDQELYDFFQKHTDSYWVDESLPGYRQKPQVQLAFLTADYETFEKGTEPTDDEILSYFEAHKDRYRGPAAKNQRLQSCPMTNL